MWASGLIDFIGSGSTVCNEFESDYIKDTTDIRNMICMYICACIFQLYAIYICLDM